MKDLLFVLVLLFAASLLAHCGGAVDAPAPLDADADAAPPAVCYTPADPFRAFPCDAEGVTCGCPDCYVADAGEGTCKP